MEDNNKGAGQREKKTEGRFIKYLVDSSSYLLAYILYISKAQIMYRRIQVAVSPVAWGFCFFTLMVLLLLSQLHLYVSDHAGSLSLSLCLPTQLTQHQNEH